MYMVWGKTFLFAFELFQLDIPSFFFDVLFIVADQHKSNGRNSDKTTEGR